MLTQALKQFLESLLEEEITTELNAQRYQRNSGRQGYRGGHYIRNLVTRYGLVENLRVPRLAGDTMDFQLFDKNERRRVDVDTAIGRLFLQGVSTRRLRGIAREMFVCKVSATTVSKTTGYLDEELRQYQARELTDDFPFLFLDGITQKARKIGVDKEGHALCAYELKEDGLMHKEDSSSKESFLVDLKSRVLAGKKMKLITTDGNLGLIKAIKAVYPFLPLLCTIERCIVCKLRNFAMKLRRVHMTPCMAGAKRGR